MKAAGFIILYHLLVHIKIIDSQQNHLSSLLERLKYKGSPPIHVTTYPNYEIEVLEGNSQIFSCQTDGTDPVVRDWSKNGHLLNQTLTSESPDDNQFFRLEDIRIKNAGRYQCYASNAYGSAFSLPVPLRVSFLHEFDEAPKENSEYGKYVIGDYAILTSPFIEGSSGIEFKWIKDGRPLTIPQQGDIYYNEKYTQINLRNDTMIPSKYQSLLLINVLDYGDAGFYKCSAMNSMVGKVSESEPQHLTVHESQVSEKVGSVPHLALKSSNVTIIQGIKRASFYCIPYPSWIGIKWYHQNNLIEQNSTHFEISENGNYFSIKGPTIKDSGSITCKMELRESHTIYFVVSEKPTLSNTDFQIINMNYNSNFTLKCPASGHPAPIIQWFHNTKLIPADKYFGENLFAINSFNFDDDGIYQCLATNFAGSVILTFWVKMIEYPPILIKGLFNTTVLYGSNITLSCKFAATPHYNISWTKNNMLLEHSSNSLFIQAPQSGQTTMEIFCKASNYIGQSTSRAFIHFIKKTRIKLPLTIGNTTYNNNSINVIIGQRADLPCRIDHDPSINITVSWYKGNVILAKSEYLNGKKNLIVETASERYRIKDVGDHASYILTFPNAKNTDKGLYSCQVSSTAGDDIIQLYLQIVELPYPPLNLIASIFKPAERAEVFLQWVPNFNGNSPIIFHTVQYKEKNLKWKSYNNTFSGDKNTALLSGLEFGTIYTFRVRAINEIGEGSWSSESNSILIPIIAPTFSPNHFHSETQSPSSILLTWKVPKKEVLSSHILGYLIKYRLTGLKNQDWSQIKIQSRTGSAGVQEYLLDNLITWKQYTIAMAVFNKAGVGPYTDYVNVWTFQGVPEIAPEGVAALVLNSSAIRVSWIPPDPQLTNGIVSGYQIRYINNSSNNSIAVGNNVYTFRLELDRLKSSRVGLYISNYNISITIAKLRPYTSYTIDVNCFTESGQGPFSSPPIHAQTLQDVPTEIRSISMLNFVGSKALVKWRAPVTFNGVFNGYKIRYRPSNLPSTNTTELYLNTSENHITIQNLLYSQSYVLNISALSEAGEGPVKSIKFTSGQIPNLPSHPIVRNVIHNVTQAFINMEITDLGSIELKAIIIEAQTGKSRSNIDENTWKKIEERDYINSSITSPASLTIDVLLKPYRYYRLRFILVNEIGQSVPSNATSLFKTEASNPSNIPDTIKRRCYQDNSCIITWSPLKEDDWNGIPKGYEIQLTSQWDYRKISHIDPYRGYYQFKNLIPLSNYTILIRTMNHKYSSQKDTIGWLFTLPSKPTSFPQNLSITNVTSTWVEVMFECKPGLYEIVDKVETHVYSFSDNMYINQSHEYLRNLNETFCLLTINDLVPFTSYQITLKFHNVIGGGPLSGTLALQTESDVPDQPIFKKFEFTPANNVLIHWLPPNHPNGDIICYDIDYKEKRSNVWDSIRITQFDAGSLTHEIANFLPGAMYEFAIKAKTKSGWGKPQLANFFTKSLRYEGALDLSKIYLQSQLITNKSMAIKVMWNIEGDDPHLPWRHLVLRYKLKRINENVVTFEPLKSIYLNPNIKEYILSNVKPASIYYFQIRAINDIYLTNWFGNRIHDYLTIETTSSKPIGIPEIISYDIISERSISIRWKGIQKLSWNSPKIGYAVSYTKITTHYMLTKSFMTYVTTNKTHDLPNKKININASDIVKGLSQLTLFGDDVKGIYKIHIIAYNDAGHQMSEPLLVYIGDSLPRTLPTLLPGNSTNSTSISICASSKEHFDFEKDEPFATFVRYRSASPYYSNALNKYSYLNIPFALHNELDCHLVSPLEPFTEYIFDGFYTNFGGNGSISRPLVIRTLQSIPGPPTHLTLKNITMDSMVITWNYPSKPNGLIEGYTIQYNPLLFPREKIKKSTIGNQTSLYITGLKPYNTYNINVAAKNDIGVGQVISANATTGPQKGSPLEPYDLTVSHVPGDLFVTLQWQNPINDNHIQGYYLQSLRVDDISQEWIDLAAFQTENETYQLPLKKLVTYYNYTFRLQSFNTNGVSNYSKPSECIEIFPDMLTQSNRPLVVYYNQWWFLIIVALSSTILILIIISWLCCKSRDKKYKKKMGNETLGNGEVGSSSILHLANQSDQDAIKIEHLTHDNTPGYLNSQILHNHNYIANSLYQTEAILRSSRRNSKVRGSTRGRKSSIRRLSQPKFPNGSDLSRVIYPEDNDSEAQQSTLPHLFYQETMPKYHNPEKLSMSSFDPKNNEKNRNKLANAFSNDAYTTNYNSSSSILSMSEKPFEAHSFVLGGENYQIKKSRNHQINAENQSYVDSDPQSSLVSHYTTSYQDRRKKLMATNPKHSKVKKGVKGPPPPKRFDAIPSTSTNSVSTFTSLNKSKLLVNKHTAPSSNYAFPSNSSASYVLHEGHALDNGANTKREEHVNKFDMMTAGTRAPLPPLGSFV